MAIRDVYVAGSNGVGYTKEVTSSADYAALPNDTYFKDLSLGVGGLVLYKDPSGNVLSIFTQANPGTVTSVGLSMPSAFSVANSPVTGSGSIAVTGAGTTTEYVRGDGSLATFPTVLSSDVIIQNVKLGEPIATGKAVYVYTADGTNIIVRKASNATEATSSKTLGLLVEGGTTNFQTRVVTNGKLGGLDTSMATIGNAVWLGVDGELLYGLPNKPVAPAHLVYIGVVTRVNSNNGEIFVSIQNGFEVDELHDVTVVGRVNDSLLGYNSSTDLHEFKTVSGWLGYTPANVAGQVFTGAISATNLSGTNTGDETNTTIKTKLGAATSSNDGYLTSTDWTSFNSKVASSLLGVSNGVATLDAGGKIPAAQLPSSIMNYHGTYDILTNTPALSDGMVGADPGDVYICTTAGTRTFGPGNTITVGLGDWLIYSQTSIWEKSDNSDSVVSVNGYTGVVSLGVSDISGAIGGSGTTNYLTKFTGTNTIGVNSLLYDTGSRIGLGITAPTALFHINNTSTADSFKVEDESNLDASPFVIDTDGKVGIGIGTPTAPLHVNVIASPSTGETLANFTVSDDLNSSLKILNNTGTDGRLTPSIFSTGSHPQSAFILTANTLDDNGNIPIAIFDARKNTTSAVTTRPLFSFRNYATTVMQINANNNVGIGTASPGTKLHVVGEAMVDTAGTTSLRVNNTLITQTDTTGVTGIYLGDNGSGINMIQREKYTANTAGINLYSEYGYNTQSLAAKFQYNLVKMYTAGVQRFYLDGNGNIGIGNNLNPTAKLHINNNTDAVASFLVEDDSNVDATPFIITNTGNVGIGNTPTAKLEIFNGALGGTTGDYLASQIINIANANSEILELGSLRTSTGSNWETSSFRIQEKIDSLWMGFIQFNGTGNSGGIQFGTGTEPARQDVPTRMTINATGNVGIGVTNPGYKLDVAGEIAIRGTSDADDARMYFQAADNSNRFTIETDFDPAIETDKLGFRSILTDNILVLQGNGNVGIGTTSQFTKLTVDGTISLLSTLNSTNGSVYIDHPGVTAWKMGVTSTNTSTLHIGNDTGGAFANKILNITDAGNVGIGTVAPSTKLDLNGSMSIASGLSNTSSRPAVGTSVLANGEIHSYSTVLGPTGDDGFLRLSAGGGSTLYNKTYIDIAGYSADNELNHSIVFGIRSSERMRVDVNGNLGIGTNSPTARLHVAHTDNYDAFRIDDDNNPDVTPFVIDRYGNVGIGTSTPSTKLEVDGDLKVSTIANATTNTGKILVSDGGVVKYRTAAETISDILTVTTTGSSGPATLTGTTLNIPQYTGGTGTFDYGVAYAMSTQNILL